MHASYIKRVVSGLNGSRKMTDRTISYPPSNENVSTATGNSLMWNLIA